MPSYFISHGWKGRFGKLVHDVCTFAARSGISQDTIFWFDVVSVNQHDGDFGRTQNRADVAAFQHVIEVCTQGTVVVCDMQMINPASRAWCLYEWSMSAYLHGELE